MSSYNPSRNPKRARTEFLLLRVATALSSGILLFILGLLIVGVGFQVLYLGKVYPGVHVGGIDLSGIPRAELVAVLDSEFTYTRATFVTFTDGDKSWTLKPEELGLALDGPSTAQKAYIIGRQGWPWERWAERLKAVRQNTYLGPQLKFDGIVAQSRLNIIGLEINRPTIEANLEIKGYKVSLTPGQIGRTLNTAETVTNLSNAFQNMGAIQIPLIIEEYQPLILDASQQAAIANSILSQPLTVSAGNSSLGGPWELDQATLASMMKIERVETETGADYQVGLNADSLYAFMLPLSPSLKTEPNNARFIFNDETRVLEVIQSATVGQELLINESITHINQELQNGSHTIDLIFDYINPSVTDDMSGQELGITELISSHTTYYFGSSTERIQNISTAGNRFHGLMVAPGETFSMVENIGDISLETGFAEALIIYGGRTVRGVGGGVCQVSTTLFRTAFFGGFPIEERYSHAYRVYYYELNSGGVQTDLYAGLDATVYAPVIDFKFINDTPHWLLMEVYVYPNSRSITWKFYSTSDGRSVDWSSSGLQEVKEPPFPEYEENEELGAGTVKQVDWAVDGATVTVSRTVTRDGETLHSDTFTTKYRPWQAVCQYGPQTANYPPDENKQDKYSCKLID